jgi:cold-inducible RNA-binding protein
MKKIYVGNLPYSTEEDQLRDLFTQYGEIEEVYLARDKVSGKKKGYAFVRFTTPAGAQASLAMHGKEFGGRMLKVTLAQPKEGGAGGGGGGHHGERRDRY